MLKRIADISEFNTVTDWNRFKNSVDAVIIRCGYRASEDGKIKADAKFLTHLQAAQSVGMPYSVYFYTNAINAAEAQEEAEFVAYNLTTYAKLTKYILPVFVDTEMGKGRTKDVSKQSRTFFVRVFMDRLQAKGIPSGVYCSTDWMKNRLNYDVMKNYSMWIANYGVVACPVANYLIWQYTDKGNIDGVRGDIDLSLMKGVSINDYQKTDISSEPVVPVVLGRDEFTPDALFNLAESEVGYLEKKDGNLNSLYYKTANAGYNNYTKYGYEMHKVYPSVMDYPAAWCFTKGTMILTDCGYKDISELQIGDKVLNASGASFNTVVDTMFREKEIYEVNAFGSINTFTTEDHPFYGRKRTGVRKDYGFTVAEFINASEYKKGDQIAIPQTKIINDLGFSYDEAWAIGYFVGDGWKTCRGEYKICGNDAKCVEIEKHFVGIHKEKMYKSRTCQEYKLHKSENMKIIPALDGCGIGAANKQVPMQIMLSDVKTKKAFIDGYLSADGSNGIRFTTVSKELALGIGKIAVDCGYGFSVHAVKRKPKSRIFDRRYGAYRDITIKPIIYNGSIQRDVIKKIRHDSICDGYAFETVKSVTKIGDKDVVYNITTDGDNTYLANNYAVHNCGAFTDWLFYKCYGISTAKSVLGRNFDDYTVTCAQAYQKRNALYSTAPKAGDQIFFSKSKTIGSIYHTGLVYKVESNYVYTYEGNTSSGSAVVANGGGVYKKKYMMQYVNQYCFFGRPNYTAQSKGSSSDTQTRLTEKAQHYDSSASKGIEKTVTATSLNLRYTCYTSNTSNVIVQMKYGEKVKWYGYWNKGTDGTTWLLVEYQKGSSKYTGYCSAEWLK